MRFEPGEYPSVYFDKAEISAFAGVDLHADAPTLFEARTNWVGPVGEIVFEEWLKHCGENYKHWSHGDRFAARDFTVFTDRGKVDLDVKTLAVKFFPKSHYACNVAEAHLRHPVDGYVFCRYILPEDRGVLFGWLTRQKFLDRSIVRRQGDSEVDNGFVSPINHHQVKISQLEKLSTLTGSDRFTPEQREIIAQVKRDFPGWSAVPDDRYGYLWVHDDD